MHKWHTLLFRRECTAYKADKYQDESYKYAENKIHSLLNPSVPPRRIRPNRSFLSPSMNIEALLERDPMGEKKTVIRIVRPNKGMKVLYEEIEAERPDSLHGMIITFHPALNQPWYCSSLTCSIHAVEFSSVFSTMAICVMAVVGAAPCQCFSPGAIQTTSPGRISSIGPPQRCTRPQPAVTIKV